MLLVVIIQTLFVSIITCKQWLDPHDMNVGINSVSTSESYCEKEIADCPTTAKNDYVFSYYKRTINFILSSVVYDSDNMDYYKGTIELNIRKEDYDHLKSFVKSSNDSPESFRAVDQILNEIFTKPTHKFFTEALITWTDHLYFTLYNRTTGILLACLFVALMCYKLLRASFTLWNVIKYLVFIGWLLDIAITWIRLLQVFDIRKLKKEYLKFIMVFVGT